jgi:hypothetical protein
MTRLLTRGSPARSSWPEMGRRRRISRRGPRVPAGKMATPAVIRGTRDRFLWGEERGRRGRALSVLGGAWGGAERRCQAVAKAAAWARVAGAREERNRERERDRRIGKRERGCRVFLSPRQGGGIHLARRRRGGGIRRRWSRHGAASPPGGRR